MSTPAFNHSDTPLPLTFFETKYQVSRVTLWRYRRAGLPAIGVGDKVFIRESDFVAFLQSMNGKTVEEWEAGRISGPLTKQELFAYLKKIGQLPADAQYKQAS